ncbi:TonB family protein [Candidatus Accumulibacter aalborgensis]|nr:TonB family protein [Candidatus Accumulibacter aalborgensis]
MPDAPVRHLLLALTVSVLLHAALLIRVHTVSPVRLEVATPTIQAVISVRPAVVAVPRPQPVVGVPVLPSPPAAPSATLRRRVPPMQAVLPATATESPAVASATLAPEQVLPSALPAQVSGSLEATPERVSPDDLRQYRVALAIAARRFKRYPSLARERGWEGTVEVALDVTAWQPAPAISLVRSSGRAALDEQAMSMIEQATAATTLPERLKGRAFRVLLPIEFSLTADH